MIDIIRKFIPQKQRSRVKAIFNYCLETVSTEYNFRFRTSKIKAELENTRHLPRNLHIEVTNICNAKCVFCAYPQMERIKETMPMEEFKRIINEYVAMGGKYVALTPIVGDPLIDKYFFERLDYLDQLPEIKGFYFYTNAILLKPATSEKLLGYGEKLSIFISWGGLDRETYKKIMGVDQFLTVSKNVETLIENKIRLSSPTPVTLALHCPLDNRKGETWEKIRKWQRQKLVNSYTLSSYDGWAGKITDEDIKSIGLAPVIKPYKRGACELLYMKPIILANGKVNACACRDVEAELIIGDLKESTLSEIWAGEEIQKIIDRHEQGDFPDVCKRCTWYSSVYNMKNRNARISKTALAWYED